MKIKLTNHIEITDLEGFEQDQIDDLCLHDNPKHAEALRRGYSVRAIPRKINLAKDSDCGVIIPIGLLAALLNECPFAEIDDQRNSHKVIIPFTGQLRDYQEHFIDEAIESQCGVMVAATGAGKTVSGIALASRLGQRCLILVKSKDLAEQWKVAIKQFAGLDCGMIGGGKDTQGEQFTIGLGSGKK